MTGGLFAIIGGAALVGAGSSLVLNPIQKQITGECMTISDTAQDIALGATIGAITGPIGASGSALAKGASGLMKFGVRIGAGAVAGGVSGTVAETARAIRGEEVSTGSFAKAIGIGALAGTVGGASTHLASSASKTVSSEVAKAITRVGVQASSGAATDVGLQLYENGEIDTKRVILNTIGQITVASTAEITQSAAKRTDTYAKKANNQLINDNFEKDQDKMSNKDETKINLIKTEETVNSLPSKTVEENAKRVNDYNKVQEKISGLSTHKDNLMKINDNPDLNPKQKAELRLDYGKKNNLSKGGMKPIKRQLKFLNKRAAVLRPELIGDKNIHFLHGDRTGQVAIDLSPPDPITGERSADRVILEKVGNKFVYADHTLDHDYEGCRRGVENLIKDPYDVLRPENMNRDFTVEEEESGDKKND